MSRSTEHNTSGYSPSCREKFISHLTSDLLRAARILNYLTYSLILQCTHDLTVHETHKIPSRYTDIEHDHSLPIQQLNVKTDPISSLPDISLGSTPQAMNNPTTCVKLYAEDQRLVCLNIHVQQDLIPTLLWRRTKVERNSASHAGENIHPSLMSTQYFSSDSMSFMIN